MLSRTNRTRLLAAAATSALLLAGCGGDEDSASSDEVTLSYLIDNDNLTVATMEALVEAFEADNPDITIEIETRPGGTEGDNIVKTRLQTGEMTDVFWYNSGSLLQALAPEQTLVDIADQPFMDNVLDVFKEGVSAGDGLFGVPVGGAMGGGILYHKPTYEELGLEIPTSWDDFMANNQAILDAGVAAPVIQTYGDTWTSQLFILADFYNVLTSEPDFAEKYTANEMHYADTPAALAGFEHLQDVHEAGFLNEDFASALFTDGLRMVATGEGVHYPMLTSAVQEIAATFPDDLENVGFFALPGENTDDAGVTTWLPGGIYISRDSEHQEAALRFLEFVASVEACDVQIESVGAHGPYFIEGCELPDDVAPAVADMLPYFESGKTKPALEFLSPVKGPALENLTVEVGSGIRSAEDAAALYDEDVKKQALQLGLEGWS
jgi:raffinose/stachyose/melibiose transport system substrate-binding protein